MKTRRLLAPDRHPGPGGKPPPQRPRLAHAQRRELKANVVRLPTRDEMEPEHQRTAHRRVLQPLLDRRGPPFHDPQSLTSPAMPKRLGKFELPNKLTKVEEGSSPTYAKFIAEPFEAGYGHTIGNSLRRVLLSSIEGAAISSIKIDGVHHEFQSIEGVVEDVTDIVLNLKKILLVSQKREPLRLPIKANRRAPSPRPTSSPTPASRSSIPDQVICTLDKKRAFEAEIEIKTGRGYCPGEQNKKEEQAIGVIPIDSLFSPGAPRQVRRREHPRRPDHRLRQAHPRNLDRRPHHPGRRPQAVRLDPQAPPRRVRPRQRGAVTSSRASRARSARSRTSSASSSTCRSTRSSSPSAPPTA